MITIYLIAYNEEVLLPYTLAFYREKFPNCTIVIYDNFSTDNTAELARSLGCEVKQFYTSNKLSDQAFINIKNNCWKDAKTDWVIVCDMDEWLNVTQSDLLNGDNTILKTYYVDMINVGNSERPDTMDHGVIYPEDGKLICFNKSKVQEINYGYGCHTAEPFGEIVFSKNRHCIYHYKWLSLEYVTERHQSFGKRLSSQNLKHKLGFHYLFPANKIKRQYKDYLKKAVKVGVAASFLQIN